MLLSPQLLLQPARATVALVATTWNASDQLGVTVSNAGRTATKTAAGNTNTGIRSIDHTVTNQQVYVEHLVGQKTFSFYFGFSTVSASLSGPAGSNTPSAAFFLSSAGGFTCQDSVNTGTIVTAAWGNGDRIDVAFDTGTALVWFRLNGGSWNPSVAGTQNPATGQGGMAVPFAGPYYANWGADNNTGDNITSNFDSANWVGAAPSGFTKLHQ